MKHMAGWSMLADDSSSLSRCHKLLESVGRDEHEVCSMRGVGASNRLPALLGNGEAVDLLKLFVHVKNRGGYDVVSRDRLWEKVGEDQGLSCSGLGSAIKLIYYSYFKSSKKDLMNNFGAVDFGEGALYGGAGLNGVFVRLEGDLGESKKNDGSEEGSTDGDKLGNGKMDSTFENVDVIDIDSASSGLSDNQKDCIITDHTTFNEAESVDNVTKKATHSRRFSRANGGEEQEIVAQNSCVVKEEGSSQKRKRQCLSEMLNWMAVVARDPTNSEIETLPEVSKWKCYGSNCYWKQVLSFRNALFLKKPEGLSQGQFSGQKKQKMHPSMFDDPSVPAEGARSSPRLLYGLSGLIQRSRLSGLSSSSIQKRIPIGPFFQAEIPEWTGMTSKSDLKMVYWDPIWTPEESGQPMSLLGKKRAQEETNDPCDCRFPGSTECIKLHISRKRMKLKAELGSAFYEWKFDKMGEEAAVSWTVKEEEKFEAVIKENPLSLGKCFWDELSKALPTKSREEVVSYYFNVFLLRRRGHQNRYSPSNIDSDDDETEFIAKSSSLILSPGKKARRDCR